VSDLTSEIRVSTVVSAARAGDKTITVAATRPSIEIPLLMNEVSFL
jgi:hypothetical protein